MSAVGFLDQDLFTFRTFKALVTNPENVWVNSYEFQAVNDGIFTILNNLGEALIAFEAAVHTSSVQFLRYTASTWEPDSIPYDPATFISVPVSMIGAVETPETELEPLGMAWRINRVPVSGRFGNIFFRGCLTEDQVVSPSGLPTIANPTTQQSNLQAAITDSLLENYFGPGAIGDLKMVMISADGAQIRGVTNLVSGGVSLIKQDHQWFNRTTGPSLAKAKKTARMS